MSASIKAVCPNCRKLIRIPVDWSERAMRCKQCGTVVQMKRKSGVENPVPVMTAPAYEPNHEIPAPAYVPPPQQYSYPMPVQYSAPVPPPPPVVEAAAFDTDGYTRTRRTYQRSAGLPTILIALVVGGVILAGSVVVGMKMFNSFSNNGAQAHQDDPKEKEKTGPGNAPAIVSDPFPRRMLFVHVSKYVYFNNLSPGTTRGEDMPSYTAGKMAYDLRIPTDVNHNQLFVLCDTAKNAPPMLKNVLLRSFEQFFNTSRDQDRIVIYFGGHAREVDGKAYLVPVDGDPDDIATLLPIEEIYTRLAACKAQQKVLMLDVCRFNPNIGSTRAGSEKMTEMLAEALHKVPPGVQVLTSCSAGQNAQETTESGSEFLTAFRVKARELKTSGALANATPATPIAADKWAEALREYLASSRGIFPSQTVKITMPAETMPAVAYNKDAPPAPRFDFPKVTNSADPSQVQSLLSLFEVPGVRKDIELPAGLALVYPFDANLIKTYAPDDTSDADSVKGDKHPLRKAAFETLNFIRENWKFGEGGIRDSFSGTVDEALKKAVQMEQETSVAKLQLKFQIHRETMEALLPKLADEKSKRWQAVFLYALAQIQMRWAFIDEYNLILGNIRTDSLEKPSGPGMPVYRVVSMEKMTSKKATTEIADAAKETFAKLAAEHKGTPIAILAKMNQNITLGLKWKLEMQQAPMEEKKE